MKMEKYEIFVLNTECSWYSLGTMMSLLHIYMTATLLPLDAIVANGDLAI